MGKRHVASSLSLCLALNFVLPTAARADDKPNAEELTNQAYDLYKKGEYARALSVYQRAYQISAATPILFNIGNVYDRKLHERDLAAEYYRRYLRATDADPDLVKRANDRLAALKLEEEALKHNSPIAPPPATKPAAEATATPPSSTSDAAKLSPLHVTGIAMGGVGIVGLVVGTVFGLTAKSKNDDAGKSCAGSACRSQDAVALTDDARSAATMSTVSFILGGALIGGGAALYFLAPPSGGKRSAVPSERETAIRITPQVGPHMAGLTIGGGFQ